MLNPGSKIKQEKGDILSPKYVGLGIKLSFGKFGISNDQNIPPKEHEEKATKSIWGKTTS